MSDWIDWVWSEEKPYPETLDTLVNVRTRDGWEDAPELPAQVGYWHDPIDEASNWYQNGKSGAEIVAYKVAETGYWSSALGEAVGPAVAVAIRSLIPAQPDAKEAPHD